MSFIAGTPNLTGTADADIILVISSTAGTIDAGAGDDFVIDNYGSGTTAFGTNFATATDLDSAVGFWYDDSLRENALVFDDSVPHMTAYVAPAAGTQVYYQIVIPDGETLTIDVDAAGNTLGTLTSTNTRVRLYADDQMTSLGTGTNSDILDGGFGSVSSVGTTSLDSYLTYQNNSGIDQTYYIRISELGGDQNFEAGDNFLVHFSLTGHAVGGVAVVAEPTTINGEAGNDHLFGQSGNDTLNGGTDDDVLVGGSGNDILNGDDDDDVLYGGSGNDTLNGGADHDNLYGGAGNDTLNGGAGLDSLLGEAGTDVLLFSSTTDIAANEYYDGGDDYDTIRVTGAEDDVFDFRDTTILNIEEIEFGGGAGLDNRVVIFDGSQVKSELPSDFHIDGLSVANIFERIEIYMDAAGNLDVSGWTFQQFGSTGTDPSGNETISIFGTGSNDVITGSTERDIIEGGAGNDMLAGGDERDQLFGQDGDDIFHVMSPDEVEVFEVYNGGADTDKFLIDGANGDIFDFRGADIQNMEEIEFEIGGNPKNIVMQVDGSDASTGFGLASNLLVDGNDAGAGSLERIEVHMDAGGVLDISGWTFTGFGSTAISGGTELETISIFGTSGADEITGTSENDIIEGGEGFDILRGGGGNDVLQSGTAGDAVYGGEGNDIFHYEDADVEIGELAFGGNGTDTLRIAGDDGDVIDFRGSGFTSIEAITFDTSGGEVDLTFYLDGDDVSGGLAANALITGNDSGLNALDKFIIEMDTTGTFDISGWAFSGFGSTASTDVMGQERISISGTTGNDTITGSSENDTITGGNGVDILNGGAGADILNGGDGADQLLFTTSGDVTFGDVINGGADNDTIAMTGGNGDIFDFRSADIFSVEIVEFELTAGDAVRTAQFNGSDVMNGLASDLFVKGLSSGTSRIERLEIHMDVAGPIDISGWTFDKFGSTAILDTGGMETISIFGTAADDIIIGSSENDIFVGGAGADALTGGSGFDVASYVGSAARVIANLFTGTGSGVGGDAAGDTYAGIEGLIGSSHNDILVGRDGASDTLRGGDGGDSLRANGGNDFVFGEGGNDLIFAGFGNDTIDGGAGIDTLMLTNASAGSIIRLDLGTGSLNVAEGDTYTNIENVAGSAFRDILYGDDENNFLDGRGGDDLLIGNGGADILDGGDGFDTVSYANSAVGITASLFLGTGPGSDIIRNVEHLVGSNFNDLLVGNDGADETLDGGDGADSLRGNGGNDTLNGEGGNDILFSGFGADIHDGGAGFDTVTYAQASAGVIVRLDLGTGSLGHAAGDTYANIENITGSSAFRDLLYGNDIGNIIDGRGGNDLLIGNGGSDTLIGGNGFDKLDGGTGFDVLTGGAGDDIFVFEAGYQGDRITDFTNGEDVIDLTSFGFTTFTQVSSLAYQTGADVVINFGSGDTLRLANFNIGDLDASDVMLTSSSGNAPSEKSSSFADDSFGFEEGLASRIESTTLQTQEFAAEFFTMHTQDVALYASSDFDVVDMFTDADFGNDGGGL